MMRKLAFDAIRKKFGSIPHELVPMLDYGFDKVGIPRESPAPNKLETRLAALGADPSLPFQERLIELFRNTSAPAISTEQLEQFANRLGCTSRQLRAVAKVEGGGAGWDNAGLLKCLWERHWLWKRVKIAVPGLSDRSTGGYTIDANRDGINDSWQKLARAAERFGIVAFECASFGKFQIMGGHWKALGYADPVEFVWSLSQSEAAHYEALARFIEMNGLTSALRQINGSPDNAKAFALAYNGRLGVKRGYHQKIATAWRVV